MAHQEIQGNNPFKKNGVDCIKEDVSNSMLVEQNNSSDDCILDLEDLENVSGGGIFADIVAQAAPFEPKHSTDSETTSSF